MKVLSSGVSLGLLTAVASIFVYSLPKVLAQDVLGIGQAPSVSNYLLAQSSTDPDEVLHELVNAYLEAENFDQALAVANRISDPDYRSSALEGMARAYIEAGDLENATQVLNLPATTLVEQLLMGRDIIGALGRAQQVFYSENGYFTESLEDLDISIDENVNYVTKMSVNNNKNFVTILLSPKDPGKRLRSLSAGVSFDNLNGVFYTIKCQGTEESINIGIGEPTIGKDNNLVCGYNSIEI